MNDRMTNNVQSTPGKTKESIEYYQNVNETQLIKNSQPQKSIKYSNNKSQRTNQIKFCDISFDFDLCL